MSLRITGGSLKSRKVFFPKRKELRPTQGAMREAFFHILRKEIEGASFLDGFSGSGIMGLEALSRNASSVTFIEKNRSSIEGLRKTLRLWNLLEKAFLLCQEAKKAFSYLGKKGVSFDIIFLDPPYDMKKQEKEALLSLIVEKKLMYPSSFLFLEESAREKDPIKIPLLSLKEKRKWGSSCLSCFQLSV